MADVVLGLGSNIGDRSGFLKAGVREIGDLDTTQVCAVSSIYRTDPVGPIDQGDFFNIAVRADTDLSPTELLSATLGIEQANGRSRSERWGPRTLDIDILTYDSLKLTSEELTIPHPRARERAFVLAPLSELDPTLRLEGEPVNALLRELGDPGVDRLIPFRKCQTVGIVGASSNAGRYSNRAQRLLMEKGHSVVPVSARDEDILGVPPYRRLSDFRGSIDTVTLYLSPPQQRDILGDLLETEPGRVIFNPGTESLETQRTLAENRIPFEAACTLVMLQTGQF